MHERRTTSRPKGPNPIRPYVWGFSILGASLVTFIVGGVLWLWLIGPSHWFWPAWAVATVAWVAVDKWRYERYWWEVCRVEYPWRYRTYQPLSASGDEE